MSNSPNIRRPLFLTGVPTAKKTGSAHFPTVDQAEPSAAPQPKSGAQPAPPPTSPPESPPQEPPAPPSPPAPGSAPRSHSSCDAIQLRAAIEMLRLQAEKLAEQARSDSLEIAFQVARRILESEVRASPEALFTLIRTALRRAGESRQVKVRLAPEDVSLVSSPQGREALATVSVAKVEVVADPCLKRGDCVVETNFGKIDGRIDRRLEELRRGLDAAVHLPPREETGRPSVSPPPPSPSPPSSRPDSEASLVELPLPSTGSQGAGALRTSTRPPRRLALDPGEELTPDDVHALREAMKGGGR